MQDIRTTKWAVIFLELTFRKGTADESRESERGYDGLIRVRDKITFTNPIN